MSSPLASIASAALLAIVIALDCHSTFAAETAELPLGIAVEQPDSPPFVEVDGSFMVPYVETIPGTDVTFEMIPIAGGEFMLGSPESEADRSEDEGPQVLVRVKPFWIGKCEVSWAEYKAYMRMYKAFKKLQTLAQNRGATTDSGGDSASDEDWRLIESHAWTGELQAKLGVDAVTSPTPLYMPDHTYMSGNEPELPAVTMTQYAARQYTKWLSGVVAREYRLPGEAEWEYAARAGATAAYSFGDDPRQLAEYGWFDENSDYATHAVGTKKPNAWGLHDVHGNAAEWTLDDYREEAYAELAAEQVDAWEAIRWPKKVYPRVIRGGSFLDLADRCRTAARQKSEGEEWKISDPNRPLSPWWYTEEPALGVGMRVVRELAAMTAEDKRRAWEMDAPELEEDVAARLQEGRGALGVADPALPAALKAAGEIEDTEQSN